MKIPTLGRSVHYMLTENDATQVNRRRTTSLLIAERISVGSWPMGAQAHIGNPVKEGDIFPMTIVRVSNSNGTPSVNGQVFLDGNDVMWIQESMEGNAPGQYHWPELVPHKAPFIE